MIKFFQIRKFDWGLGIGDWGIGDWGWGVWPNPQPPHPHPPIPNPQYYILTIYAFKNLNNYFYYSFNILNKSLNLFSCSSLSILIFIPSITSFLFSSVNELIICFISL